MLHQRAVTACAAGTTALAILLLGQASCAALNGYDESGWGYVSRKGDADAITKWTLRQRRIDRIEDGILTLSGRISTGKEVAGGARGMVAVYNKLAAGWPGIDKPHKIEDLIAGIYGLSDRHLPEVDAALDQMRPPDSLPLRLARWRFAKGLEREYPQEVPPAPRTEP